MNDLLHEKAALLRQLLDSKGGEVLMSFMHAQRDMELSNAETAETPEEAWACMKRAEGMKRLMEELNVASHADKVMPKEGRH